MRCAVVGSGFAELPYRSHREPRTAYRAPMFEFTPFSPEHVELMSAWLERPHVAEWWDDRTSPEEVREDFLDDPSIRPYIVYWHGEPVGFIQSYVAAGS